MYSGHVKAKPFRWFERDSDAPSLRYDNQKTNEKTLRTMEAMTGSLGAAATGIMVKVEETVSTIKTAIEDFQSESKMSNPREKAADFLLDVQVIIF